MAKYPVVIDLETKHTFRDFSEPQKLGVSVIAYYDYNTNKQGVFTEKEIGNIFPILEQASYVVGYNIETFDIPVLQPYYAGRTEHFSIFDILADIRNILGRRLALNDVASATLGKKKTGHGLMAIDYYKEGKWDELKKYCLDDVLVTKELFDFGLKHHEIYYLDSQGRATIKVNWNKFMDSSGDKDVPMTLPF